MAQAGPELEPWHQEYAERGLVAFGVSIYESPEQARAYWEDEVQHTHPWAADAAFQTSMFATGQTIGTPAYLFVDLETMRIVNWQEGYSGAEETIFTPYLRP
jgi:hypothetical protein